MADDLPVLTLEQRRILLEQILGGGPFDDDALLHVLIAFWQDGPSLYLRWRWPGQLSCGGILVTRQVAEQLGIGD